MKLKKIIQLLNQIALNKAIEIIKIVRENRKIETFWLEIEFETNMNQDDVNYLIAFANANKLRFALDDQKSISFYERDEV
jgi:hypothetical protein